MSYYSKAQIDAIAAIIGDRIKKNAARFEVIPEWSQADTGNTDQIIFDVTGFDCLWITGRTLDKSVSNLIRFYLNNGTVFLDQDWSWLSDTGDGADRGEPYLPIGSSTTSDTSFSLFMGNLRSGLHATVVGHVGWGSEAESFSGQQSNTDVIERIDFFVPSGNFTKGTISISGIKGN